MRLPLIWSATMSIVGTLLLASVSTAQVVVTTTGTGERSHGVQVEGVAFELGIANPEGGEWGALYGGSVSLGTLFSRWLDFSAGARYWTADIERTRASGPVRGTLRDFSLHANLSVQTVRVLGWRPYLVTGLGGHLAGANIEAEPDLEDALAGFHIGLDAGVGVSTVGTGFGVRAEARRSFVEDVGHWSFTLGLGWWPKHRARSAVTVQRATAPASLSGAVSPTFTDAPAAELQAAIERLRTDNRELRVAIDSLRTEVRARPIEVATPLAATAEAPSVDAESRRRHAELAATLDRLAQTSQGAMSVIDDGDGVRVRFTAETLFGSGSASPQAGAIEQFRRLSIALFRFPSTRVVVEGHTDSAGSDAINLQLSQQRAEAVRAELIRVGIGPERIQAVGRGSAQPIADNGNEEGRRRNRRVEIIVLEDRHANAQR